MLNGLLVTALCIEQARKSNDWPAYLYGAAMGLTTSIGGLMYAAKMDGFRFLLDAGTGLPLSMVSGLGAIGVVTYLLARKIK